MHPTGEQITINFADQRAVLTEVGGALRVYEAGAVAVVEGWEPEEMPDSCRGQVCYPWINRTSSGEWSYAGRTAHVGADNVDKRTLNHGVVRWRPFRVEERGSDSCTLSIVLNPVPEYPFWSRLTVLYRLSATGLAVTSTVENLDEVDIPFTLGFHPYFAVTTPTIDGARLRVPAEAYLAVDDRLIPTGHDVAVAGTVMDFREAALVDGVALDVTFAQLARDEQGLFRCNVVDANGGEVEYWQDESFPYFQVFSGDTLRPPRRRSSIALEPMTGPADALRSGRGRLSIAPGASWSGSWGVRRLL